MRNWRQLPFRIQRIPMGCLPSTQVPLRCIRCCISCSTAPHRSPCSKHTTLYVAFPTGSSSRTKGRIPRQGRHAHSSAGWVDRCSSPRGGNQRRISGSTSPPTSRISNAFSHSDVWHRPSSIHPSAMHSQFLDRTPPSDRTNHRLSSQMDNAGDSRHRHCGSSQMDICRSTMRQAYPFQGTGPESSQHLGRRSPSSKSLQELRLPLE